MNMQACSALYDMRDCEQLTENCTAMCPCIFKGHDAVAVFTGKALHVHYSSKEAPETRLVSHIAGVSEDGPGCARFCGVRCMTYVPATNKLIVCDSIGRTVRSVHLEPPFTVSTLCGRTTLPGFYLDGSMRQSLFSSPYDVCVAPNGVDMYVTDYGNHAVRKINTLYDRVHTIFGGRATTTNAGAADDFVRCRLMLPMGLKMAPCGKFLYVVNYGRNSICELQVDPGNGDQGRLVRAFAVQTAKYALPTVIDVTPCGHVIVWRPDCTPELESLSMYEWWFDRPSILALYDPCDGQILFKMETPYTPGTFFMRFAFNENAVTGTMIHAIKLNRANFSNELFKTSLIVNGRVKKLLLRDMQKIDTKHPQEGGKASAFARIPLSIVRYIIDLVNNPFCVAVHP